MALLGVGNATPTVAEEIAPYTGHRPVVLLESMGVYWRSVFYALEGKVPELWLVNAMHVKRVPGRKTDVSDAEWLTDVAAHGMVRPSYVPTRDP